MQSEDISPAIFHFVLKNMKLVILSLIFTVMKGCHFAGINSRYSNNTVSEHLLNSSSVTSNSILVVSLYLIAFYFSRQTIIRKSTVCISAKVKKKKSVEKTILCFNDRKSFR